MSRRILRPQRDVCQLCDFITTRNALPIQAYRPRKPLSYRASSTTSRSHTPKSTIQNSPTVAVPFAKSSAQRSGAPERQQVPKHVSQADHEKQLQWIKLNCDKLFSSKIVPPERSTTNVLMLCKSLAADLVSDSPVQSLERNDGAASALLSLGGSPKTKKLSPHKLPPPLQRIADELSNIAFSIVKHPSIFITPKVLELYTGIQSSLGKPESFPGVFNMYASKPLAEEGSSPIRYIEQNPNKVANAVPVATANRALETAIDAKQLVVAMDIIDSTYTKTAFLRAKLVSQALLPATALMAAPVAAYAVASQFAELQSTMDSALATNVAFAGLLAYVGFTATIGVVAVTTANDQMDRVTWAEGMPLRERWIREDERAAIDRIAGAWGFRETWRRGEEEGEDWEALREWIGRRGMILDRVSLMEGME